VISIIVTNRNGRNIIKTCLESLLYVTLTSKYKIEFIIVDDHSTDNSVEIINNILKKTSNNNIKLISLSKRVGSAKARNIGATVAKGKYLIFVDNDTRSVTNWIDKCIEYLRENNRVAVVQPFIVRETPDSQACGAGGVITPTVSGYIYRKISKNPIFYALGAALVIRKDIFHQVRGFCDYLEYGHVELDLCWRVRLAGLSINCVREAYVNHLGRTSRHYRVRALRSRNRLLMIVKNLELRNTLVFLPLIILKIVATEHPLVLYKILSSFLKLLPKAIMDRASIGKIRRVSDYQLFQEFRSAISRELKEASKLGSLPRLIALAFYKLSSFWHMF